MFCPQCGTQIKDQPSFCPQCGHALTATAPRATRTADANRASAEPAPARPQTTVPPSPAPDAGRAPVQPAPDQPYATAPTYIKTPTPDGKKAWKCNRCHVISNLDRLGFLHRAGMAFIMYIGLFCGLYAALIPMVDDFDGSAGVLWGLRIATFALCLLAGFVSAHRYRVVYGKECPRCGMTACQSIQAEAFSKPGLFHSLFDKLDSQAWYRSVRAMFHRFIAKCEQIFRKVDVPAITAVVCAMGIFMSYYITVEVFWAREAPYMYVALVGLLGDSITEMERDTFEVLEVFGIIYTLLPLATAVRNMNPIKRTKKIPLILMRIRLAITILLFLIASRDRMAMVSFWGEDEIDLHGARFLILFFNILMLICVRICYEIDRQRCARLSAASSNT